MTKQTIEHRRTRVLALKKQAESRGPGYNYDGLARSPSLLSFFIVYDHLYDSFKCVAEGNYAGYTPGSIGNSQTENPKSPDSLALVKSHEQRTGSL